MFTVYGSGITTPNPLGNLFSASVDTHWSRTYHGK